MEGCSPWRHAAEGESSVRLYRCQERILSKDDGKSDGPFHIDIGSISTRKGNVNKTTGYLNGCAC